MSISQEKDSITDGIRTFYSLEELKSFSSNLVKYYETQIDRYNRRLDTLLRQSGSNEGANRLPPVASKGWIRVGRILVSISNPAQASTEMLFRLLEDAKAKLDAVKAFLGSLEGVLNVGVKKEHVYLVCLRNGVPERIIIEEQKSSNRIFTFNVRLQVAPD